MRHQRRSGLCRSSCSPRPHTAGAAVCYAPVAFRPVPVYYLVSHATRCAAVYSQLSGHTPRHGVKLCRHGFISWIDEWTLKPFYAYWWGLWQKAPDKSIFYHSHPHNVVRYAGCPQCSGIVLNHALIALAFRPVLLATRPCPRDQVAGWQCRVQERAHLPL
jgi:hypothetical protein